MSLALYRTYRPGRLSEVIGQEHVTEPLRRALDGDRVHHAFLFSGPRGCGKTSTARILARSLLCEQGPTADPCGECRFCEALAPTGTGLVDVIELDAASHGGVDDTRELRERAAFVPAEARYKIYIIDEAHMVSKDGFNALLKLIEEPPEHVKFIFATTEVDKVLPTIRSRTFNYTFRLVPVRQLVTNLAGICDTEGVAYEPAALTLIARASGGSVRDAQSIMGQLIAGAGPQGLTQQQVADQLGVTDEALLDAVIDAVAAHDGAALFDVVERTVESGHDVRRFVTDLLHRFRDLIVLQHAGDGATADVLDVSQDRRDLLAEQATRFGPTELTRYAETVNTGLTQVKGSTSPRLQLEILAARLLVPTSDSDPEATLARLEVVERRLAVLASAPQPGHGPQPGPAGQPQQHTPQPTPSSEPGRTARSTGPAAPTPDVPQPDTGPAQQAPPSSGTHPRPPSDHSPALRADPALAKSPPRRSKIAPPPPPNLTSDAPRERPAVVAPPTAAHPGTGAAPPPPPAADPASPPPGSGGVTLEQVQGIWPQLLEQVRDRSRVAAAAWDGAVPVGVAGNTLTVRIPSEGQARSIRQSKRDVMLRTLLIEGFGFDLQVAATAEESAATVPDEPSDDDPDVGSEGLSGVDLAMRELGATKIGEIEET